jgi:hypothetical protein
MLQDDGDEGVSEGEQDKTYSSFGSSEATLVGNHSTEGSAE